MLSRPRVEGGQNQGPHPESDCGSSHGTVNLERGAKFYFPDIRMSAIDPSWKEIV